MLTAANDFKNFGVMILLLHLSHLSPTLLKTNVSLFTTFYVNDSFSESFQSVVINVLNDIDSYFYYDVSNASVASFYAS